jgi:hypothetical protein
MNIQSTTIVAFIERFEELYGKYLQPQTKSASHTEYFKIHPGKQKYSDWDLKCVLAEDVKFDEVQQMLKFIESYTAFDSVGHFMTDAEEFANNGSHISGAKLIQVMAIMKDESHAPFVDISIRNVKNSYVKRLFKESFNEEFISWAMLTSWRKIKNNHLIGVNSFVWITVIYLLPHYSRKIDQKAILSKPQVFFRHKLTDDKYKRVLKFLSS